MSIVKLLKDKIEDGEEVTLFGPLSCADRW